ncbi:MULTISPECIES: PQQ-binding-like beta-propeller repeat protein [unclassified Streptomyces]|uniref:outer membrane protein assembly factor BamB family protein n=1 Tax=unclassified Streptomyces TaxID=2593676 RepID=UPI000CD57DD3|nr:PQQ-binding-like beta-propeller repeat protein [Streptomyces sp. SM10]
MTQPPGQQPPQGGFGAPYDPPPGPAYGYPPQQPGTAPGPYAQQPGPYGQPPQGGYGFPSQPQPVAAPQGPGGGGRFKGRTGMVVGAVLALALIVGGGVWFALGDDDAKKPAAGGTSGPSTAPEQGDGTSHAASDVELAGQLDARREPGEAKVRWLQSLGTDLPGRAMGVYGPWEAGDVVAKAMYRTVSGYSTADGTERWSLRMPEDICAAPTRPTTDGRIVVAVEAADSDTGADCSVLQMIDLRTGKPGWRKTLEKAAVTDTERRVVMAANGDTVTYSRPGHVHTYRVGDGQELFGAQPRDCRSYAFLSGARTIAAADCPGGNQIQEFDPASGKKQWTYALEKDWFIDQVYSVSPLVVSVQKGDTWRVLALRDNGTLRSRIELGTRDVDLGFADYEVRCGGYLVVTRNRDDCAGVAADDDTFYVSTKRKHVEFDVDNRIVAFDLNTGEQKWTADAPLGRRMEPLRTEGGKLLLYVAATRTQGGAIATLGPTGGTPRTVLTHPASTATIEAGMTAAEVLYEDGRSLLTLPLVGMEEDDEAEADMKTMIAFGE